MAKEMIEIPMTPERTKPEGGNLRRNSTGKTSTSNSEEKILPHYLRASTSSCHDFCKYGRKHAFAAKGKRPLLKRITATMPEKSLDPIKSVILAERKKKSVVRLNPSPDPKPQLPKLDQPQIIKRNVPSPVEKIVLSANQAPSLANKTDLPAKQTSLLAKRTGLPAKQASSPAKKIVASAKPASGLKPKTVPAKLSSLPLNPSRGLNVRRNNDVGMVKNTATSKVVEKKALVPSKASLSPKPSVKRVISLNTRQHRNVKAISPPKNQIKVRQPETKPPSPAKVEEKILYIIEPKPENGYIEPTPNETYMNQLSPSLLPSSSSTMSSAHQSSPSLSSHEEEQHEESEVTVSEEDGSFSEYEEIENEEEIDTLEVEDKRMPRRGATIYPEDNDSSPQKLNFRRGKVVSLQSETNGPRRLRFRQGRVLGENQNGHIGRRSFRRREVSGDDSNGIKPGSEKVVLRHQDVQGKKDAQGLFNNVIEETASKLVETRKSKVKALVGAFETVISLQESKPTSPRTG